MSNKHIPVTFLDSAGEVISNDPIYLAKLALAEAGVGEKVDFDIPGPYDELEGDELKALARERGISTRGFRKASTFREALEAWDEENPETDSDDDDDESTGEEVNGDSDNDEE